MEDDFKDFLNIDYFYFHNHFFCPTNKYGVVLYHLYDFDIHNNITKKEIYEKTNITIKNNKPDNFNYINSRVLKSNWLLKHNIDIVPKMERRINRFRDSFKNNNNVFYGDMLIYLKKDV